MADFNQFGSAQASRGPGDPQHCAQCEAMLTDALDGTLSSADQATFDLHIVGCTTAAAMLADAQRGADLAGDAEVSPARTPASLLERIIAQTVKKPPNPPSCLGPTAAFRVNRAASASAPPNTLSADPLGSRCCCRELSPTSPPTSSPSAARVTTGLRLSFGHTMLQPRLAMTAAMAFFSIALTMNLTGVRLSQLHASDLNPRAFCAVPTRPNAAVSPLLRQPSRRIRTRIPRPRPATLLG